MRQRCDCTPIGQSGDFTSARLGSRGVQDGTLRSGSEKAPDLVQYRRGGEENEATNVNILLYSARVPVGDPQGKSRYCLNHLNFTLDLDGFAGLSIT